MTYYHYLCCIPLLFFGTVFYKMGKDYIEVTYYEKSKRKIN